MDDASFRTSILPGGNAMNDFLRVPRANFPLNRRALLKYSVAGFAIAVLSPWPHAHNGGVSTAADPNLPPPGPEHLPAMRFTKEVVVVPFSDEVFELFVLNGT